MILKILAVLVMISALGYLENTIRKELLPAYRRKKDERHQIRKVKAMNLEYESKAGRISEAYVRGIVDEIHRIEKKHNANGFISLRVHMDFIDILMYDALGYPTSEKIPFRDLSYSPVNETIAVAGAIKRHLGSMYLWETEALSDFFDSDDCKVYTDSVRHRNPEQLNRGGIKPF